MKRPRNKFKISFFSHGSRVTIFRYHVNVHLPVDTSSKQVLGSPISCDRQHGSDKVLAIVEAGFLSSKSSTLRKARATFIPQVETTWLGKVEYVNRLVDFNRSLDVIKPLEVLD